MKLQLITGPNRTKEITITPREVTLMLGETTGANIGASIEHACQILESHKGESVLYINTVQTLWKIADSINKNVPDPERFIANYYLRDDRTNDCVYFMTADTGELHKEKEKILNFMRNNNVKTVIINSWEFAAKNSRLREALLFIFRGLNNGDPNPQYNPNAKEYEPYFNYSYQPATVIIYAEALANAPLAGKINRGGFGKLAALADQVIVMESGGKSEVRSLKSEVGEVGEKSEVRSQKSEMGEKAEVGEKLEVRSQKSEMGEKVEVGEKLEVRRQKSEMGNEKEETLTPDTEHLTPRQIIVPVTSINELRKPQQLDKLPIHLNNYSPDKKPAVQIITKHASAHPPMRPANVQSDVVEK